MRRNKTKPNDSEQVVRIGAFVFSQLFRYTPRAQIRYERIFFFLRINAGKLQVAIHWAHTRNFASVLQNKILRADESTENTMLENFPR